MKDRSVFLRAACDCIRSIEDYTAGYDLDKFLEDKKTQDAVIRNLEVRTNNKRLWHRRFEEQPS